MVRAGIPQGVIMASMGWKTREVFDRQGISPQEDLRKAAADDAAKRPDYLRFGAGSSQGGHKAEGDEKTPELGTA
ncbi:MAG TPA: hypothetical protein VMS88_05700 [Terriglobales bacterium]|nr:hypothetical protein [Terriglobales bacterium]